MNENGNRPPPRIRTPACRVTPVLLVALALVLFSPALSGNLLAQRDLLRLTVPYRALAAELWSAGVLPLWNSAAGCGTPLLADPVAGVLDPFTAFFLLPLPPLVVGTWVIILRYGLAGILMARFLRRRNLDPLSSALGGAAYMLSGFSVGSWTMYQWVAALPLLPLALAAPRSGGTAVGRGLAAATVFALYLFSGAPEPLLAGVVLWSIEVFAARPVAPQSGHRDWMIELCVGLIAALALALVQILPTVELLMASDRWGGRGALRALTYSVTPLVGIGHILPLSFLGEGGGPAVPGIFPFPHPLFFSTYVGVALLPLALLGAVGSRRAPDGEPAGPPAALSPNAGRMALAVVAVAGWLAAYGSTWPGAVALLTRAPWLSILGFPVKLFVLVPPALAILAAMGCSRLTTDRATVQRHVAPALNATALLVIALVTWGLLRPGALSGPASEGILVAALTQNLTSASQHALVALLALLVILVGVLPQRPRLARGLVVALVVLDLGVAARHAITWESGDVAAAPLVRTMLHEPWPRVLTTANEDFAVRGTGARHVHEIADVASGIPWRIRHTGLYASFEIRSWNRWWQDVIEAPDGGLALLGAAGVRWFACDSGVAEAAVRAGFDRVDERPFGNGALVLLGNPGTLPEVRFYAGERPPSRDRLLGPGDTCAITGRHRLDGALLLDCETSEPGWIFRAESWSSGWGATIDGARADAVAADGLPGQLLRVAAGARSLIWDYRPETVTIGLAGSLAALLAAGLSLAVVAFRKGSTE